MTSVGVGAMKIWWRFGLLATRQKDTWMACMLMLLKIHTKFRARLSLRQNWAIFQVNEWAPDERVMQVLLLLLISQMVCASAKLRWWDLKTGRSFSQIEQPSVPNQNHPDIALVVNILPRFLGSNTASLGVSWQIDPVHLPIDSSNHAHTVQSEEPSTLMNETRKCQHMQGPVHSGSFWARWSTATCASHSASLKWAALRCSCGMTSCFPPRLGRK